MSTATATFDYTAEKEGEALPAYEQVRTATMPTAKPEAGADYPQDVKMRQAITTKLNELHDIFALGKAPSVRGKEKDVASDEHLEKLQADIEAAKASGNGAALRKARLAFNKARGIGHAENVEVVAQLRERLPLFVVWGKAWADSIGLTRADLIADDFPPSLLDDAQMPAEDGEDGYED